MDRRRFLSLGTAGVAIAAGGRWSPAAAAASSADRGRESLFGLGVASGEPAVDGFVLWTRLVRDVLAPDGGMGVAPVPVHWQVGSDERCGRVVARGTFIATLDDAHSVHAVVAGLRPGRPYWYRFRAGNGVSAIGRARTLPAWHERGRLRLITAADASYSESLFPAYEAVAAEEDLDVVVFLGDYIYDDDPSLRGKTVLRRDTTPEGPPFDQLTTLTDYRRRHAVYKTDPLLQAAHAAAPWIAVPDDHEVEDNYAGLDDVEDRDKPTHSDRDAFARQRAAAYKAYWEHLPFRPEARPVGASMRLHRSFTFGRLAALHMLDTRQFRQHPALFVPGNYGPEVLGRTNPGTMLGAEQEAWLTASVAATRSSRWQLLGQQVAMMQARLINPAGANPPTLFAYDQWDGFGPARTRLLSGLAAAGLEHLVVLTGDVHAAAAGDLRVDFDAPDSPIVGSELITTAISTGTMGDANYAVLSASNPRFNPHVRYLDRFNGYLRITIEPELLLAEYRQVASITERSSPVTTRSTLVIDHDGGRLRRV